MSLLRNGRPAALAIAIAFCCCAAVTQRAAAQQEALDRIPSPQRALINDLRPAQEVEGMRKAHAKSSFEQFCERLDSELGFVARACKLTQAERRKLDEVRNSIVGEFKPLLDRPQQRQAAGGGQRMVAVNDQVVILNAQGAAQVLIIPDRVIRSQTDRAVNAVLSQERLTMLESERKWREEKAQRAQVLALAAAIDEAMLLGDDQLPRICEYLDANWRPVWKQVSANQFSAPGATPLQTAKARGLGGVFDLFDVNLEPLLRPAQMAAWRELRTLRVDAQAQRVAPFEMIFNLNGGIVRQGVERRAGGRIIQRADGAFIAVPGDRPAGPLVVPIQPAPGDGRPQNEQERASIDHPPIVEPPRELAMFLELLVEDAAQAAELSDAERETLLLAGKLDIQRYRAEREAELRERFEQADEAPGNEKPRVQTETLAASNPFASPDSRFRKALIARLSDEQLARLAKVARARRQRGREAAVQSFVREFDERLKLPAEQWDALADALRRRLPPLAGEDAEPDARSDALASIADVGMAELRGVFDEDQWAGAEQKLNELKQAAAQAVRGRGRQEVLPQLR